jgi:hypothetical protein
MVYGDGIRRNIATVSPQERSEFINAIIAIHEDSRFKFEGSREETPAGGVSYWFKQDEIHAATHVHHGPAFLSWHRELCNQFEDLLREANPNISLHYWDWNQDPQNIILDAGSSLNLFTEQFMGKARGALGEPWESKGFYVRTPDGDRYRASTIGDTAHSNPFDPPLMVRREVWRNDDGLNHLLKDYQAFRKTPFYEDMDIINSINYKQMRTKLEHNHDAAHLYVGGDILRQHTAFRDPFVFLIHSNVDRLFAEWQYNDKIIRLNPDLVYGEESETESKIEGIETDHVDIYAGILTEMAPWNGSFDINPQVQEYLKKVRPWTEPEKWHEKYREKYVKNSKHPSVVISRKYDTIVNLI